MISIVVRAYNDEGFIGDTLRMLSKQKCSEKLEIIVCDDNSSDNTLKIIKEFQNVKLMLRPDGKYIPGKTLNALVKFAKGDIIVFNNADAIPLYEDYIEYLVAPLKNPKQNIIATYGNQLPRQNAQFLVKKDNLRAFGNGKVAQEWEFFFSIASAAIIRNELLKHPFDENIQYSEDVYWAWNAKIRGEDFIYVQQAKVFHSHNYSFKELKKRFFNEGIADGKIFGGVPNIFSTIIRYFLEVLRDIIFLLSQKNGWKELLISPIRRYIQKFYHRRGMLEYKRKNLK